MDIILMYKYGPQYTATSRKGTVHEDILVTGT